MTHNPRIEDRTKISMKYVTIIFALVTGLAQAQEQTVASAQKFIAGLAEDGALTVTLFGNTVETLIYIDHKFNERIFSKTFPADKISSTNASEPCSTNFYVDLNSPTVSSIEYTYRGLHTYFQESYSEKRSETVYHPQSNHGTRNSYNFQIDWSKVPAVEKSYQSISMLHADGSKVEIFVKSKDYATRLHYAMEFLRIKCDKKSATGF